MSALPRPTHKRCPKCDQVLPIDAFSTSPSKRDGHHAYCRPCVAKAVAEYRTTDIGRLSARASARKYAAKNRARNLAAREASTTTPE